MKDLDLVTKGDCIGLKDFLARYRELKNAQERIAAAVYYLTRNAGLTPVTGAACSAVRSRGNG